MIMIRRNKKARFYRAPFSKVLDLALESNFCDTVRFNVQVNELENINAKSIEETGEYFEIES